MPLTYRAVPRVGRIKSLPRGKGLEPLPREPHGVDQWSRWADQKREWEKRIGPTRLRRALELLDQGVKGTLPELCAYNWLEDRGVLFDFQSSIMGGRLLLGGAVADFIIMDLLPGGLMIWRIQGEHWHSSPEKAERDRLQRDQLLRSRYHGEPIQAVVDLWEDDIYNFYPNVFFDAEAGVGYRD